MVSQLNARRQFLLYGGVWWFRWSVRLLIMAAIFGSGFVPYSHEVGGKCHTLPIREQGIRAPIDGVIEEVFVEEGDRLTTGAPIVTIAARDQKAAVSITQAQLAEATAELKKLRNGPLPEEIEIAAQAVETWKAQLEFSSKEFARQEILATQKVTSDSLFDQTVKERDVAKSSLLSAQEYLKKLRNGTRPEEIMAAEAKVARISAELAHHQEDVRLAALTAPFPGCIVTPNIKERVSQYVRSGDLIAVLHDTSRLRVEVAADESAPAIVKVGMQARIRLNALNGRTLKGRVVQISSKAMDSTELGIERVRSDDETHREEIMKSQDVNRHVRVYLEFDENDSEMPELVPGMSGYAKVTIAEEKLWPAIWRNLQRFLYVEAWSWLP